MGGTVPVPSSDKETGIDKAVFQEREGLIPAGSGRAFPGKSPPFQGYQGMNFELSSSPALFQP